MRQSTRFWALLFALVVVALELSAQPALAADAKATKRKVPKIKRTIRVREAVPAPGQVVVPAVVAAAPAEPASRNVEMKNEGSTNNVKVQPSISIGAPAAPVASVEPTQMQIVPYQAKQVVPIVEEPDDEDDQVEAEMELVASGNANKLALVHSNNNLELATLGSNNRHAHTLGNSNNQLVQLAEGNGNSRQTVVRNSGNTEHVHIDGVGNHKVTRISNAGNSEQQEQQEQQQVVEPRTLAVTGHPASPAIPTIVPPANSPLVQINMNDMLDRVRAPAATEKTTTLIQPVVYGMPQSSLALSQVPSEQLKWLSASQRQAMEIAGNPAGGLINPLGIRQWAPQSPHNSWSALAQMQQPMVMVVPAQQIQQPMMMMMTTPGQQQQQPAYGLAPMMPMFYPHQGPIVMAPQMPFIDYHRDRHARNQDRELHKLRVEERIRRAERRAARREAERAHKEEAKTAPKPNVIVVNNTNHHKQLPAPLVTTTTPAPKVVVIAKEPIKEPAKEKIVVEEPKADKDNDDDDDDEEEEEEETIEWETVRVPKRRIKIKKSASKSKST